MVLLVCEKEAFLFLPFLIIISSSSYGMECIADLLQSSETVLP